MKVSSISSGYLSHKVNRSNLKSNKNNNVGNVSFNGTLGKFLGGAAGMALGGAVAAILGGPIAAPIGIYMMLKGAEAGDKKEEELNNSNANDNNKGGSSK